MRQKTLLIFLVATFFALVCTSAFAQEEEHGHGKGHSKRSQSEGDDKGHYGYSEHDRDSMRGWYKEHSDDLPPGLAKRDLLPPGLEKQLAERGTLPPGLQKKIHPCPQDLEEQLPPPPPSYSHVLIGGSVVLLNRTNFQIMDVFQFEK